MQDGAPEQAHPTSVGDDVLKNTPVNVRHGKGWAILDTSCYSWKPGVHDIGAALDLTSATMLLVVLRAAESWAPESEDVTQPDAVICREGRVLVEFTDGSTQQLDLDAEFLPNTRPLMRVTNLSTSIANVLLINRKAG
jgi:hypothetical protein